MKKRISAALLAAFLGILMFILSAQQPKPVLDPKFPTVVTLWNSYNTHAKNIFDSLVLEFNETVGLEKGIVIDSYNYADSKEIGEALYNSANGIIGSDPLPNIFTSYPNNAYRIDQLVPLVELDQYFSESELRKYRTEFMAEGIWGDNLSPKMIPVAKSMEVLYLNKTDWDKFVAEAGVGLSADFLNTWEGILKAAELYYEYSGGKPMLGFNPFNDFMFLTTAQLDNDPYLIKDGEVTFAYTEETAKKVWDICYVPHIKGWFKSESYSTDGVKSGNLLAYLGSSAGAEYFPTEVTVDPEHIYPIECSVLPYPTFENRAVYMGQRGANMCITASDEAHEYGAAEFLKWFTQPEQNIGFAVSTGYIPVENEALTSIRKLVNHTSTTQNSEVVENSLIVIMDNMNKYKFSYNKQFESAYEVNELFQNAIFEKIKIDMKVMQLRIQNGEIKEDVISSLIKEDAFNAWYEELCTRIEGELK